MSSAPSEAGFSVRSSSMANGNPMETPSNRSRQSSFAHSSMRGGSRTRPRSCNILNPEHNNGGLDEGLITEIAKLREFMKREEEDRLGIVRPPESQEGDDVPAGEPRRLSNAETTLDRERFIPGEYDNLRVERKVYEMKCDKLCISPVRAVIRHCGGATLDLKYHPIGPLGAQAIAAPLLINTTLLSLNLQGTGIEDSGFRSLVSTLLENTFLQELSVSQCNLTVKSCKEIARLLAKNMVITRLDLGGNNLGDSSAEAIASGIKQTRSVSDLNLSDTGLGPRAGEILGPAIGSNDTLSILDLSWNHISRKGAVAVAKGIQNNVRLHQVNLAWNGFGQEGAVAIGELFKSNSPIMHLNLSHNRIGDSAVISLATGIEKNEDLMYLDLSHNYFTNVGVLGLLKGVEKAQTGQLDAINLQGIVLDDKHPDFKGKLDSLKQLRPNMLVHYDQYPIARTRADLLLLFFKKLQDKHLDLEDLFKPRVEWTSPEDEVMSKEEFIIILQKAGLDMPKETLYKIGNQLDIQEKNMVSLSVLSTRHEQFEKGEYQPEEEFPFPSIQKKETTQVQTPRFFPPAGLAETTQRDRNDSANTKRASFSTTATAK